MNNKLFTKRRNRQGAVYHFGEQTEEPGEESGRMPEANEIQGGHFSDDLELLSEGFYWQAK